MSGLVLPSSSWRVEAWVIFFGVWAGGAGWIFSDTPMLLSGSARQYIAGDTGWYIARVGAVDLDLYRCSLPDVDGTFRIWCRCLSRIPGWHGARSAQHWVYVQLVVCLGRPALYCECYTKYFSWHGGTGDCKIATCVCVLYEWAGSPRYPHGVVGHPSLRHRFSTDEECYVHFGFWGTWRFPYR